MPFNFTTCKQSVTLSWAISVCKKQLKYSASHECRSPSKESPLGMCCNNIRTWASLKSQMLTVPVLGEKGDSGDFLTNVYLTYFPLICSQNKCHTRDFKVNGDFPIKISYVLS